MKIYNENKTQILIECDLTKGHLVLDKIGEEEILLYIAYTQKELCELEILKLQNKLAQMDYKTSKYTDGEYTDIEWQKIVAERKSIRERIRELEKNV